MVEYRNFPLVLKTDGTNPIGIAESSSIGTLYISSLVVSTVYADTYQNIPGSFEFTGILTVTSTGSGTPIVDASDPNNPKFTAFSVATDGFVDIGPHPGADPGLVITYGSNALGPTRGGTGYNLPGGEGEIPAWTAGGQLQPRPGYTISELGLSIPDATNFQINGQQIGLNNLAEVSIGVPGEKDVLINEGGIWGSGRLNILDLTGIESPETLASFPAPTTPNTYLIYDGTGLEWTAVTGTGGGTSISIPPDPGRIPYVINSTTLDSVSWFNIETGTGRVNVCSVCAVGSVCATTFVEGGQSLSVKYLTKAVADTYYQACDVFLETLSIQQEIDLQTDVGSNPLLPINGGTGFTSFTPTGSLMYADGPASLALTPAPQTNKYLKWNGTAYIWDSPTGTGTGTTIPNTPGRIPYIIDATSLGDVSWFNIETGTGRVNVCSVCAVGSVCATTFVEGGQTLVSKYQPVGNYQPCDVFLTTLTTHGSVRLNTADVTNILPLTKGGLGFTSLDENRILVGGAANSVTTITSPSPGYLKWNGTAFAWDSPTGTVSLPSDACAVVFMNPNGDGLVSNPAIRINNIASTLIINSDADAGTGGIDLYPDSTTEGFVRWDPQYHSLGIQGSNNSRVTLGVDEIIPVSNHIGSTIYKGQVCYVSGADSGSLRGRIALLSDSTPDPFVLGVALANISDGAEGYLIKKGLIRNANQTNCITGPTPTTGNVLYVSDQPGKLTTTSPAAGKHAATVGLTLDVNGGNISFGVSIDKGYDLADLHDVNATPTNDGETLVWNTAGGYYTTGTINDITGTLSVPKGGTGKTTFNPDQLIYSNNFAQSSDLTFNGTVLKSPVVCGTTVCATTFEEGGTTLASKYLTQANAVATYQTKSDFSTFTGITLKELAYKDRVDLDTTSVTGTLTVSKGGTGLTALTAGNFLIGNGTSISLTPTSTFETTGYSRANFATIASLNNYTLTSTFNTFRANATETEGIVLNDGSDNLYTTADLKFVNTTTLKTPQVCATTVCATTFEEGGTILSTKYQGKNTTLDSISNLTFNNNNYFYKNNTGTFVTGTVTPCAVQLLDDATYSDMRTTLGLGSLAIKSTISNSDIDNATIQFSKLANGAYIPTGTYTSIGLGLASSLATPATISVVLGNTAGNAVLLGQNSVGNSYTLKHQEGIIKWYKDIEVPAEVASPPEFISPSSTYYSSLIVDDLSSVNHYNENSYIFYAEVNTLSATTISATNYFNLPTAALSGLSDVQITSPALSSVLKWNGSKWVPATDLTGGGGGGSPGGSQYAIQVNDGAGGFYGDASLQYDYDTPQITINTALVVDAVATFNGGTDFTQAGTFTTLRGTSVSSTTVSATTYLNLPSGVATWNANKINGYSVTSSAPGIGSLLIYQFPDFGNAVWQYYGAEDLGELAIFNAEKIQSVPVAATTPKAEDTLVYNGTAWAPKSVIAISNIIGNNLISS